MAHVEEKNRLNDAENPSPGRKDGILTNEQLKKLSFEGKMCLLGGFCLHLMMGTFYMWGGVSPYISSFLYINDKSTSSVDVSGVFPYMGLAMNCCLAIGIKIARKVGYKTTIFCGVLLMTAAVIIGSFMTDSQSFIGMYVVLCGLPTGVMYMLPIACAWAYYPLQRGFVSGFILCGFGIGSLVFTLICSAIVNPNNQQATIIIYINGVKNTYFEECVGNQVPKMFRVLAGCYILLGSVAWLTIQMPKENLQRHYELVKEEQNRGGDTKKIIIHKADNEECKTLMQGIFSKPFVLLVIMAFSSIFYGMSISGFYKTFGKLQIPDDKFITIVGSVGSAFNGCSRLFWALIYDRYNFKKVHTIISIIQLVLSASMYSISTDKGAYFVWVCLSYTCLGGFFGIFPPTTSKIFGKEVGPVIYGIVFISFAMANIAGFLLVKFNFNVLDWSSFFWIGFALTAFGMIMNNCFFDEKYRFKKVVKQPKAPKKIEMSKTDKKTIAESKPNDVFNTNMVTESQKPMMTTERDLKGNAIVKESGDDFGIEEKGKSFDLKKSHLDNRL